ncbi:MAG: hypothetical protein DRH03_09285 [Deltaproteobacteria bacterium]|nr:MAG: hypothetical protein DRH03_09285 [Deltaproteobacteria bacterium]
MGHRPAGKAGRVAKETGQEVGQEKENAELKHYRLEAGRFESRLKARLYCALLFAYLEIIIFLVYFLMLFNILHYYPDKTVFEIKSGMGRSSIVFVSA